ncbi:MAG TPA: hypothetical protein VMH00_02450 [Candidatus Limnocylindrales bacterium]|nr:hypothetical protein [Candidatus Limnocylindrales bacterium]
MNERPVLVQLGCLLPMVIPLLWVIRHGGAGAAWLQAWPSCSAIVLMGFLFVYLGIESD